MAELPDILTIPEAADYLRVSETTMRRIVADGSLPIAKARGGIRITREDLLAYVQSRKATVPQKHALSVSIKAKHQPGATRGTLTINGMREILL